MQKCPECEGKMVKAGVMQSGKYSVMKCELCGHEEMECIGLV